MNRLTKAILGAGLFLVMAGGMLALAGWGLGGETELYYNWHGGRVRVSGAGMSSVYDNSSDSRDGNKYESDMELAPFDTIQVDLDLGDIDIRESDSYGVELEWRGVDYNLHYTNKDGVLKVWSTSHEGFSIGFSGGYHGQVVVYVPYDTELNKIDVDADLGDLSLYGITCSDLIVEDNLGEVNLENVTADTMDLTLDLGSLYGDGLEVASRLLVESSLGDVTLSGDIGGKITISCDMGSVDFYTEQQERTFGYDLSVDMGSVSIDGEDRGDKATRKGGTNYLEADSGMGDVSVEFG